MKVVLIVGSALAGAMLLGACGHCVDVACATALELRIAFPLVEAKYDVEITADGKVSACQVQVPVPAPRGECGSSDTVWLAGSGGSGELLFVVTGEAKSVAIRVVDGDETLLEEVIMPRYEEDESTRDYCGGPCSTASESRTVPKR